jgi:general secretion pathway protein D
MEQPFFNTRRLTTSLLIYNGATVVMGGMITEVRTDVEDKVPILGDIPIIGRLFRSRYESSEKKNLLIFVTARLVDPSGRLLDSSRFGVDSSIAERIVSGETEAE